MECRRQVASRLGPTQVTGSAARLGGAAPRRAPQDQQGEGPPMVLSMDNGPEMISQALQQFGDGKVGLILHRAEQN